MLFNERNDAVKFIDDYGLMILVVKRKENVLKKQQKIKD